MTDKSSGKTQSSRLTLWKVMAVVIAVTGIVLLVMVASVIGRPRSSSANNTQSSEIVALPFTVTDAEYSQALDRIIIVGENANQLHIYNPDTQDDSVVDLPLAPTSVSVGPDGLFAAVGHFGQISYIDLKNKQLIKTLSVSVMVTDVVLGGNGSVYYTGNTDPQHYYVKTIDLATGSNETGNFISGGLVIRLHNGGQKIYGAEIGGTASSLNRLDIAPDNNIFASSYNWAPYRFPYFDDYPVCGDLWFSNNGERIFTACGSIFQSSTDPKEDMIYSGKLTGLPAIRHLTESPAAGLILGVSRANKTFYIPYAPTYPENLLAVWDDQTLANLNVITLSDFMVDNQQHAADGRFVFVNDAGTRYFVIVQADGTSQFGLLRGDLPIPVPPLTPTAALPVATGPVQLLGYAVVDAEYSPALDRLITVSQLPNRLHIYDPASHAEVTVDLASVPTSVSVSPDGLFAAVGHDALVSYVDLKNAQVAKTFPVKANVWDIVLAGNGWFYVTEPHASNRPLLAVEIATGKTVDGPNLTGRILIRLHQTGGKLYGTTDQGGTGDQGMMRINLGVDGAAYPSPNDLRPTTSDYIFVCRNLWPSDDEQRIFTACGNVYRSSENTSQDMTDNGMLSGISLIRSLASSQGGGMILALPMSSEKDPIAENQLFAWEYNTLSAYHPVTLPDFNLNDKPYAANGRYVFVNPLGTQYYVIAQTGSNADLPGYYGVVVGDTQTLTAPSSAAQTPTGAKDIIPLNFRVRDAEYSSALDRIIAVSENPNRLHIYDPVSQRDAAVSLLSTPTSVSVSPDGLYAAVGHDHSITVVNLQNENIASVLKTDVNVVDLVLAGNSWIYLMHPYNEGRNITAIEIATGKEVAGPFFTEDGVMRLHPNGQNLYIANQHVGPADILRVDLGSFPFDPQMAQALPAMTGGSHYICSNLWLSGDGKRIFTACGAVFRISDDPRQVMTYETSLEGLPAISSLFESQPAKLILAVPLDKGPESPIHDQAENLLGFWNMDDLQQRAINPLPDWTVNGTTYPSNGRFVFVNSTGSQYYVIVQAGEGAGLLNDYGVIVGEMSEFSK